MRLTQALLKQLVGRQWERQWMTKKVRKIPSLYKPAFIDEQGIEVIDANEFYTPKKTRWVPPVADDPNWMSTPTIEDHPHYHTEPILALFHQTKLDHGLKQASLLAKTLVFEKLPEAVKDLLGKSPIPGQNDLMRRFIMQAHVWDSTFEKLPRRFNPDLLRWKFKAEWGIPKDKIAKFLTNHIMRMTLSLSSKYPDLMKSRQLTEDPILETYISHRNTTIQIQASPMCLVSANQNLTPFGNDALLDESCNQNSDDLWPISSLIDLKPSHLYTLQDSSNLKSNQCLGFPHTVFINNALDNIISDKFDVRKMWSTEQRHSRALLLCLALTTQQARLKYGNDVTTLPEPIPIQCIHHDGVYFNFLYFQLNTLDFSTSDGVKNFAWIDSDNRMVEKIEPKRSMMRNTIFQNYDPAVYDKIRATLLNGLAVQD